MGKTVEIIASLGSGLVGTLLVTVYCILFSFIFGLWLALCRRHLKSPFAQGSFDFFTFVLRAIPIPPLLFLIYFGGPRLGLFFNPYVAVVLSLGVSTAAYLSEVFRGCLAAVDPSETEAALSAGMSSAQAFWFIEWPQAARMAIPGMINEVTSIIKYSPFAYTVGIPEVTKFAMNLTAVTLRGLEIYAAVGVLYFVLCQLASSLLLLIEQRYRVPGIGDHALT